ncbi:MAG: WYL domain-containing transcriptional regulator [Elusimicrobia bacterium]|nr:WYL domain-containing transcriptional regulator [Elusimicrobiota bacterium]
MPKTKIIITTNPKKRVRKFNNFKYRIMRIIAELHNRGFVRAKDLEDKFEVGIRTIERDLNILKEDHFIVQDEFEKGKWLFDTTDQCWDKLEVTDHDAATLAFLYKFSKVFGGQISSSVLKAIDKMFCVDDTEYPFFMITPRVKRPDTELPFYKDLYDSIQNKNKINLTYKSAGAEKTVKAWPFSLIMCDGMWYLGYLLEPQGRLKQELRTLRYSHILRVEPLVEETFEKPAWVKETLKTARNIWFNRDRSIRVVMQVSNRIKDYFELNEYFPAQKIVEEGPDSFKLEAKICVHNEAVPNILRFLPDIKVLEPKDLKDEVNRRIKEYSGK